MIIIQNCNVLKTKLKFIYKRFSLKTYFHVKKTYFSSLMTIKSILFHLHGNASEIRMKIS